MNTQIAKADSFWEHGGEDVEAKSTENYPSQAVCDRLGLKKEGILRQAEWVNDHFVDLTMNSVLRGEWMARLDVR